MEENSLYVGKSKIDGFGVLANREYEDGETVIQPGGRIIQANEVNWDALRKRGYDDFLQIGSCEYLELLEERDKHLNHSCDPNLGFRSLDGIFSFVAIKSINRGNEVTFDYSTTMLEEEDEEPMECRCGSKNCRKIIGDFRNLPQIVQERYIRLGVVPKYILEDLLVREKCK